MHPQTSSQEVMIPDCLWSQIKELMMLPDRTLRIHWNASQMEQSHPVLFPWLMHDSACQASWHLAVFLDHRDLFNSSTYGNTLKKNWNYLFFWHFAGEIIDLSDIAFRNEVVHSYMMLSCDLLLWGVINCNDQLQWSSVPPWLQTYHSNATEE